MSGTTGPGLPDGVSMTALGVAWVRAVESARSDRLFDDPLAARFLEASGWEPPDLAGRRWPDDPKSRAMLVLAQSVIVRTRFLDDLLAGAWEGGARQVVILGAGLDTRAFRLRWPRGSRCFELDLPAVLAFKEDVLTRAGAVVACDRTPVAADLLGDWTGALEGAGFDRALPTVWIAEGLLIYFSQAENDRLLADVGRLSSPGHRLAITSSRPGRDRIGRLSAFPPDRGGGSPAGPPPPGLSLLTNPAAVIALWRWEGPLDPAAWLAGHGWQAEVFDREERARAYGRPLEVAEADSAATRTLLIDARRV